MRSVTKEQFLSGMRAAAEQAYRSALVAACAFWLRDYEHKLNHTDQPDPKDPTKSLPGTGYFTDPKQPIKQANYTGLLALLPKDFDLLTTAAKAEEENRASAHLVLDSLIRDAISKATSEQMKAALAPLEPFMQRLDLHRTEVHSRAVRGWVRDQTVAGKVRKAAVSRLTAQEKADAKAVLAIDLDALELKRKGLVAVYSSTESTEDEKKLALNELEKIAGELDVALAPMLKHAQRLRRDGLDAHVLSHKDAPRHVGRVDGLKPAEVSDAYFVCSECGAKPDKLIEVESKLLCSACLQKHI